MYEKLNYHVVDCIKTDVLKEAEECEDIDECSSSPCLGGLFLFVCSERSSLRSNAPLLVQNWQVFSDGHSAQCKIYSINKGCNTYQRAPRPQTCNRYFVIFAIKEFYISFFAMV